MLLGLWNKAMPPGGENYTSLQNHLLAWYLTNGHQVTMYLELPIMSWVLLESQCHKVEGWAAVHHKLNMTAEGTAKLCTWPRPSVIHNHCTSCSSAGKFLMTSWRKKKSPKLDLWIDKLSIRLQTETGSQWRASLLANSEERKSFQWVEVQMENLVINFLWKERWPEGRTHIYFWTFANDLVDWSGAWKEKTGKSKTRSSVNAVDGYIRVTVCDYNCESHVNP